MHHRETILGETPHIHNILENQTSILTKKKKRRKKKHSRVPLLSYISVNRRRCVTR